MEKLKVANVCPPHVTTQSYINLSKVYSYISKKYNCEITFLVDKKIDFKFKNFKSIKVFGLDNHFGLYKILFFLGLPRFYYPTLVKNLKGFDVIESSTPEFYIYALQSYHAAKKYNSKLVLRTSQTIYDFFLFPFTKFIALFFARKAFRFASSICFTNNTSMNAHFKIGLLPESMRNSKKISIIGHAVDTSTFKPIKVKKDKKKFTLLSVGALFKVKGHQNIIKALKLLVDKGYKNIVLRIAGKGQYRQSLESLTKKLGLMGHVKFLGALGHKELGKEYNYADVFVLANLHDVTPAVSEAMLCNLPVIASRCGGIDFVMPSKDQGLITKHDDPIDLARGIEILIKDKKLRKKIIKTSRKFILDNFSIEKVAERIYKAYVR